MRMHAQWRSGDRLIIHPNVFSRHAKIIVPMGTVSPHGQRQTVSARGGVTQSRGPNANFGFVELLMVQIAVSDLLDKVRQQIENMALRQRPTLVDLP
jgi:hypothetical protein